MSPRLSRTHMLYTIAVIGFIYTLHLVIPMYSNSSFLSLFADEQTVGFIFMAGAAVSILGFLIAPGIIRKIGNYEMAIILVCIQIVLFYGLIALSDPVLLTIFFILQSAVVSLIGLCLDIFLEVYTDGMSIGAVRGLYTATLNASWVIAPLIGSMVISGNNDYRSAFLAALAMLFPLVYLIHRNFPRFKDPNYMHMSPWQLVKHVSTNSNLIRLFIANIILQTFYSWMVVYSAIYLNKTIGFSWEEIGIILVIMLIPFPLIQYPLGKISDGKSGEKRIMAIGFAIMGVATLVLSLITVKSLLLWAGVLFITRIGAAAAEIMMEIYFFKTVPPKDSSALGIFRITRPVSYFIAPLITIVGLLFTTDKNLFVIIGLMCLVALLPVLTIRDAK